MAGILYRSPFRNARTIRSTIAAPMFFYRVLQVICGRDEDLILNVDEMHTLTCDLNISIDN